ncbi:transposable element Tcb2 transposase [Trichonephila clavipes]|nr:transposable element Tcb2 transposase [Trichonephila clavipes]
MDQWAIVLFTNESRFSLNTNSRRTFIWREPGTHYLSNVHEIDNYGGRGSMVWAGIMLDGRTPLHVFERGSVTSVRYRDSKDICRMDWPSRSQDFNRIEHVWDAIQEMKTTLLNEWDQLPQEIINCLISRAKKSATIYHILYSDDSANRSAPQAATRDESYFSVDQERILRPHKSAEVEVKELMREMG